MSCPVLPNKRQLEVRQRDRRAARVTTPSRHMHHLIGGARVHHLPPPPALMRGIGLPSHCAMRQPVQSRASAFQITLPIAVLHIVDQRLIVLAAMVGKRGIGIGHLRGGRIARPPAPSKETACTRQCRPP